MPKPEKHVEPVAENMSPHSYNTYRTMDRFTASHEKTFMSSCAVHVQLNYGTIKMFTRAEIPYFSALQF